MPRRGRPEIFIHQEQLLYLVEKGFSAKEVGVMFGCFKRTIFMKS